VRGGLLFTCCLALSGCFGIAEPSGLRLAAQAQTSPGQDTTLLRVMGRPAGDQPLLPQPGNIWADVLPPSVSPLPAHTIVKPDQIRHEPTAIVAHTVRVAPTQTAKPVAPLTKDRPVASKGNRVAGKGDQVASQGNHVASAQSVLDAGDHPMVQLAAVTDATRAEAAWRRLRRNARRLTDGHNPEITSAEVNGRHVWRLRAGGFDDVAAAGAFCSGMRTAKADCWVVPASAIR